jgi:pyrroline-5-carboxylate reductase
MVRLVIVGGGRMGEALLGGLLASGWAAPAELAVIEVLAARRDELAARFPGVVVAESPVAALGAVVAVKPPAVPDACRALASQGVRRLLSIAAGVTLATLEEAAGGGVAVVRSMPNTPALVGAGASAIAAGSSADDDDLAWAEAILGAVGEVVRVGEHLLDAVTGLSGSGPAYVFLVAEALIDAGVQAGLPRDVSSLLANQTLLGAARMLVETGQHPAELRNAVTSPGGTTAAGLHRLEAAALRAALADAVAAATDRSRQLAGG